MKPEAFENKLSSQPLKRVPAEWRAEILAAARAEAAPRPASPASRFVWLAALERRLASLLWPHPRAWAGLAAAWVLILAVNLSMREATPARMERPVQPAAELAADVRQQRLMLAELMGATEARVADRQLPLLPKPHSSRRDVFSV